MFANRGWATHPNFRLLAAMVWESVPRAPRGNDFGATRGAQFRAHQAAPKEEQTESDALLRHSWILLVLGPPRGPEIGTISMSNKTLRSDNASIVYRPHGRTNISFDTIATLQQLST